jgi:hypothetical protein
MKTLNANLITGQQAASQTPHIHFVLSDKAGGTTYDYSSRILGLEHREEVYKEEATVVLDNSDLAVVAVKGYWVEIGYGLTVGGTGYVGPTARLWVKQQMFLSSEGVLRSVLKLEGAWAMMDEVLMHLGSAPLYDDGTLNGLTVYEALGNVISAFATDTGYTFTLAALGTAADGVIDVFQPILATNQNQTFDTVREVIEALMAMTRCFLRSEPGLVFRVVYPQDTDLVNESYYSNEDLFFDELTDFDMLVIPNRFVVYSNYDAELKDFTGLITSDSDDLADADAIASQSAYMTVTAFHLASTIDNETDSDARAAVLLYKAKMARLLNRINLNKHDAATELFDKVAVFNTRS